MLEPLHGKKSNSDSANNRTLSRPRNYDFLRPSKYLPRSAPQSRDRI